MSANNILIIEEQEDGTFIAYDRSVEEEEDVLGGGYKAFEAKDLPEAVERAQQYMTNDIVEYGYRFSMLPAPTRGEPGGSCSRSQGCSCQQ